MISLPNFLALCAAVFALLYVGWRVYAEAHPIPRPTVEAQEAKAREPFSANPRYSFEHDYSYDAAFMLDTPDERDEFLRRHGIGTRDGI